jgi:leader peptidase (prepilin peptidase)/N-methyltransferase
MVELFLFTAAGSIAPTAVAGVFGLMVGSFLNVVIHRLPKMWQRELENYTAEESGQPAPHTDRYDLAIPRSACPHCNHQITALENIPVVSYLALRGKCRNCKAPISPRYPAVELFTGCLSAFLIWHFGSGVAGLATLVFAYLLIAMSFIDADTQFLPDDMVYPLLWCGLLVNLHGVFAPLQDAVIGAVAGYMALWSVNWLFMLIRKKQGMGHGDFKLLAALGAWFGWSMLPSIILMSSVVGAVVGIVLMILSKRGFDLKIPFGPYLAGAGFLVLLYGKETTQLLFDLTS